MGACTWYLRAATWWWLENDGAIAERGIYVTMAEGILFAIGE